MITARDVLATVTIITGSTIAVAFASHEDTINTIEELFSFYMRPHMFAYGAFIGCSLASGLLLRRHLEGLERRAMNAPEGAPARLQVGKC